MFVHVSARVFPEKENLQIFLYHINNSKSFHKEGDKIWVNIGPALRPTGHSLVTAGQNLEASFVASCNFDSRIWEPRVPTLSNWSLVESRYTLLNLNGSHMIVNGFKSVFWPKHCRELRDFLKDIRISISFLVCFGPSYWCSRVTVLYCVYYTKMYAIQRFSEVFLLFYDHKKNCILSYNHSEILTYQSSPAQDYIHKSKLLQHETTTWTSGKRKCFNEVVALCRIQIFLFHLVTQEAR